MSDEINPDTFVEEIRGLFAKRAARVRAMGPEERAAWDAQQALESKARWDRIEATDAWLKKSQEDPEAAEQDILDAYREVTGNPLATKKEAGI